MKLEDLTPEQKEKALSCKTPEEIIELARESGYELSDDELASVAGGWGDPNCTEEGVCNDYCYRLNTI